MEFDLTAAQRQELTEYLAGLLENYYANIRNERVCPPLEPEMVREFVSKPDLVHGTSPKEALDHVVKGLSEFSVHTPHPAYFGLFNPRPNFASILADWITATFNPQMAAWSHNPFANEVENFLVMEVGQKMGYPPEQIDGNFGAGGAEANLTAVLCALRWTFPDYLQKGLQDLDHSPVMYCSAESHHSIQRAARVSGLGAHSVKIIPVDAHLRMIPDALSNQIKHDRSMGQRPFMVFATGGTTGAGSIDPLEKIADICAANDLWYHVDAAYGGAARFFEGSKHWLDGIEKSHSITIDIHKWMSVPMGASIFVTREKDILSKTFSIDTAYMPKEASQMDIVDPYTHSIQWSRRFIGLKFYLSLLFYGWEGYEQVIKHHLDMGQYLKTQLIQHRWKVMQESPLPVVCFVDADRPDDQGFVQEILTHILSTGKTWISQYPVLGITSLRACITNYATTRRDIDDLISGLEDARNHILSRSRLKA